MVNISKLYLYVNNCQNNSIILGMKTEGIGNDSTALANKTTKNSPVVVNSEIYVLYIGTLFETIIFFRLDSTPSIFLPDYPQSILKRVHSLNCGNKFLIK